MDKDNHKFSPCAQHRLAKNKNKKNVVRYFVTKFKISHHATLDLFFIYHNSVKCRYTYKEKKMSPLNCSKHSCQKTATTWKGLLAFGQKNVEIIKQDY